MNDLITTRMGLRNLTNEELTRSLAAAASRERRATIEVIAHIHEFMIRRLYIEYGCTSLFAYLTTHLHFSEATAQNRIDAARMLNSTPELAEKISSGAVTLTQVSVVAQALRQQTRERISTHPPTPIAESNESGTNDTELLSPLALFSSIEGLDSKNSAVVVARKLNIKPIIHEKVRPQQDESIRLEVTLSKEEWAALRQARDLLSHRNPNASVSDVIAEVTKYFVNREYPRIANRRNSKNTSDPKSETLRSAAQNPTPPTRSAKVKRIAIPAVTRRLIFARDRHCQWVHPPTGTKCRSTFLLQIDHRVSVCAGGSNEPENLQLLCATHNRWKFEHA